MLVTPSRRVSLSLTVTPRTTRARSLLARKRGNDIIAATRHDNGPQATPTLKPTCVTAALATTLPTVHHFHSSIMLFFGGVAHWLAPYARYYVVYGDDGVLWPICHGGTERWAATSHHHPCGCPVSASARTHLQGSREIILLLEPWNATTGHCAGLDPTSTVQGNGTWRPSPPGS